RIHLEDLAPDVLVRLHGNTAIAAFRQRVYYEMQYDLRQLEDGLNALATEITRRIGGATASAKSDTGTGSGDGGRGPALAAAHVQIKDLQAKLAPPQQQAQRKPIQQQRRSRGMEM
ncbi:MAG: hypothetical protein RIE87_00005, partial [Rhodospirillales bacterium]